MQLIYLIAYDICTEKYWRVKISEKISMTIGSICYLKLVFFCIVSVLQTELDYWHPLTEKVQKGASKYNVLIYSKYLPK